MNLGNSPTKRKTNPRASLWYRLGDYNEEVCLIKLYYDNNEIEEDYDSYGCEAGDFCEQWSLYEDEEDDEPYE